MSDSPTLAEVKELVKLRDGAWAFVAIGAAGSTWSYATTSGYTNMSTFGLIGSLVLGAMFALGAVVLFLTRVKG